MNNVFKKKQAKVISNLQDYSDLLVTMVVDNHNIQKLVDKVNDIAKGLSSIDLIFDKFDNFESSFGLEVFETYNEYMKWLINYLNGNRNNDD